MELYVVMDVTLLKIVFYGMYINNIAAVVTLQSNFIKNFNPWSRIKRNELFSSVASLVIFVCCVNNNVLVVYLFA
jgi:hypothetical protein